MKSRINKDEREISISELWWYVISKWKGLVIGMVIGALVMGAFGIYKLYGANTVESPKEVTMDDLTEEEQKEVKELIADYQFYESEVERLENNYLMSLDYNNVTYYLVTYYVDTDYSYNYLDVKEDYTETLISIYKTYLYSDEMYDEIKKLGIKGLDESDITYLYYVSNEANLIKIGVVVDAEWSEIISNTLCENLEDYYSTTVELIGEHSLIKISKDNRIAYNEGIKNGQNYKKSIVTTLATEIETEKTKLNHNQIYVYKKEIMDQGYDGINGVGLNDAGNSSVVIKYIIIGVIGGFVFATIMIIMIFLFGGKIKSIGEIQQVYGIELLGKFVRDKKRNKVALCKRYKIYNVGTENKQEAYITEIILNKCKDKDIKEVVICSSVEDLSNEVANILNELNKAQINCKIVNNIHCDNVALNTVIDCKNVIIAELMDVTNRELLEIEIETCDKLNVNILGMIAII